MADPINFTILTFLLFALGLLGTWVGLGLGSGLRASLAALPASALLLFLFLFPFCSFPILDSGHMSAHGHWAIPHY